MTPEQGRLLWKQVLDSVTADNPHSAVLQHVLMGVLVDIVEKRMELSDTFAVTIGSRIEFLNEALQEKSAEQQEHQDCCEFV